MKIKARQEQACCQLNRSILVSLLSLCLLLTACQTATPPQGFTANVVQVVNGQAFEVVGVVGQPEITERVQLEGIRVPSLHQSPWGEAAKMQLEQLIGQQPVLLETDTEMRDVHGQRLAYAWQHGVLLNEKLVAAGYALAKPHAPNDKYDRRLARAQDQARVLELGIWNPKQPLRQEP